MLLQMVHYSEWIIAPLLLLVYAWVRFSTPPTNRSGTTCAMFYFGVVFYYALLVALCLLVIIMLKQGGVGLDWLGQRLSRWFDQGGGS